MSAKDRDGQPEGNGDRLHLSTAPPIHPGRRVPRRRPAPLSVSRASARAIFMAADRLLPCIANPAPAFAAIARRVVVV